MRDVGKHVLEEGLDLFGLQGLSRQYELLARNPACFLLVLFGWGHQRLLKSFLSLYAELATVGNLAASLSGDAELNASHGNEPTASAHERAQCRIRRRGTLQADQPNMSLTLDEVHFSVQQLAGMWALSQAAIRRLFRNEPGVLRFGREKRGHVRDYVTLRIPASVAERVYRRCIRPNRPDRSNTTGGM